MKPPVGIGETQVDRGEPGGGEIGGKENKQGFGPGANAAQGSGQLELMNSMLGLGAKDSFPILDCPSRAVKARPPGSHLVTIKGPHRVPCPMW